MLWYQRKGEDAVLRVAGALMLALAYAGMRMLLIWGASTRIEGSVAAFLLAMASFLLFSTGMTLAVLGRHIFDQVRISRRWRRVGNGGRTRART